MRYLFDTHLLLWLAEGSPRLPRRAVEVAEDPGATILFSAVSLWEIAIKTGLNRPDFHVDPALMQHGLLTNGFEELPVKGVHAIALNALPLLHRDPFDRMLIAQAVAEQVQLLSMDRAFARYSGPIEVL